MLFSLFVAYLLIPLTTCDEYDELTKEFIASLNSALDTPFAQEFEKLQRFHDDLSQFISKMTPLAKSFAIALKEKKEPFAPLLKMTKAIREKLLDVKHGQDTSRFTSGHSIALQKVDNHSFKTIKRMLAAFETIATGNKTQEDINTFDFDCYSTMLPLTTQNDYGSPCVNTKFSVEAASNIFGWINSFQYENYELSPEEDRQFTKLFTDLYLNFNYRNQLDSIGRQMEWFIKKRKGTVYKNKVTLLEEISEALEVYRWGGPICSCIPLSAFVVHHFKRDVLLGVADMILSRVYATTFITQMCAYVNNYSDDPLGVSYDLSTNERNMQSTYSIFTKWLNSTLQGTFPTTESELTREIMNEAANGAQIPEDSVQYGRMAQVVHNKMKPFGHPSYRRLYLISKHSEVSGNNPNFDYDCLNDTCSRSVSSEVQCITVRIPKNKTDDPNALENVEQYAADIKPNFKNLMEKHTNQLQNFSNVVSKLKAEYSIDFEKFTNHSSYFGIRENRYGKNCKITYGLKMEEGIETRSVQILHYHNDGDVFSNCNDWLFFLGL